MEYLKCRRYRIQEKSFRFYRGEIDLIAYDGGTLVFIEVKARYRSDRITPEESVTLKKQQQIRRIARAYLSLHNLEDQKCRFDVLALRYEDACGFTVSHYIDAF